MCACVRVCVRACVRARKGQRLMLVPRCSSTSFTESNTEIADATSLAASLLQGCSSLSSEAGATEQAMCYLHGFWDSKLTLIFSQLAHQAISPASCISLDHFQSSNTLPSLRSRKAAQQWTVKPFDEAPSFTSSSATPLYDIPVTMLNASQKGILFSQMPDSSDYEGDGRPLQIQDATQVEHARCAFKCLFS